MKRYYELKEFLGVTIDDVEPKNKYSTEIRSIIQQIWTQHNLFNLVNKNDKFLLAKLFYKNYTEVLNEGYDALEMVVYFNTKTPKHVIEMLVQGTYFDSRQGIYIATKKTKNGNVYLSIAGWAGTPSYEPFLRTICEYTEILMERISE